MKAIPLQLPLRAQERAAQREQGGRHQFHKTVRADECGESPAQMPDHLFGAVTNGASSLG